MGPGDVHDNRPDEPACGKHGEHFMFDGEDFDGNPLVECVACMKLQNEAMRNVVEAAVTYKDCENGAGCVNQCVGKLLQAVEAYKKHSPEKRNEGQQKCEHRWTPINLDPDFDSQCMKCGAKENQT
jgi:hypothetical protein